MRLSRNAAAAAALAAFAAAVLLLCLGRPFPAWALRPTLSWGQQEVLQHARQRSLAASLPANVTVGSVSASLSPVSTFSQWCSTDTECSAAGSLSFGINAYSTASLAALTITNMNFNRASGSYFKFVSALVDFQIIGLNKTDAAICGASQPCTSTLTFVVSGVDLSMPLFCLRFAPDVNSAMAAGGNLPLVLSNVGGYPDARNGTSRSSIIVQNTVSCTTSYFGQLAVAQQVLASPPPTPSSPPAPPPPPPQARPAVANGTAAPAGAASVAFSATFALDFDALGQNSSLLSSFKQDVLYWLAVHLAVTYPSFMLNPSTGLPYYDRVSILLISRGSVAVLFQARLPQGTSDAQVQAMAAGVGASAAAALFGGSAYVNMVQLPFRVTQLTYEQSDSPFWTTSHIALIAGCVGGFILVVVAAVLFLRWRRGEQAILPPKPGERGEGDGAAGGHAYAGRQQRGDKGRGHKQGSGGSVDYVGNAKGEVPEENDGRRGGTGGGGGGGRGDADWASGSTRGGGGGGGYTQPANAFAHTHAKQQPAFQPTTAMQPTMVFQPTTAMQPTMAAQAGFLQPQHFVPAYPPTATYPAASHPAPAFPAAPYPAAAYPIGAGPAPMPQYAQPPHASAVQAYPQGQAMSYSGYSGFASSTPVHPFIPPGEGYPEPNRS